MLNYYKDNLPSNFVIPDYLVSIDKNIIDAFNNLTTTANNKNSINYLESLIETQIARSKKLVYEYNKK